MKCSDITLKVFVAKKCGLIKSNAHFWKNFSTIESFEKLLEEDSNFESTLKNTKENIEKSEDNIGNIVSIFDKEFPVINKNVKNSGEKPYLLFYKGNLKLLADLNNNVGIIGLTTPSDEIEKREKKIVEEIVKKKLVIVSGLAKGCDSIAHSICVENEGKTIAILPTEIEKIYPAENKELAKKIVEGKGLIISEYYQKAKTKFEAIKRFVERDRLQAMFSKAIILVASYREGEGDSGSRHAMESAKKYKIKRYAVYNSKLDYNDKQFGLNKDFIKNNEAEILYQSNIEDIKMLKDCNLDEKNNLEQLKMI